MLHHTQWHLVRTLAFRSVPLRWRSQGRGRALAGKETPIVNIGEPRCIVANHTNLSPLLCHTKCFFFRSTYDCIFFLVLFGFTDTDLLNKVSINLINPHIYSTCVVVAISVAMVTPNISNTVAITIAISKGLCNWYKIMYNKIYGMFSIWLRAKGKG